MSSINFDNVWLLLLALPLVVLFVIPYAIAIRRDNLNGHNLASGIIHVVMALLIAFAAAGTSVVTTVTETNVYVVADVSYSTRKNFDLIDDYISDLSKSLPRNSKMGVVTFGKYYQLLTPLGGRLQSVKNSSAGVDASATDIIGALRYTGELFREDVIKRIVLITDGNQTSESDANALKRQVDALAERNIHVDAIYIDSNMTDEREVQLSAVEATPTAFLNSKATARLTVNINYPAATGNDDTASREVYTFIDVTRRRTDEEGAEAVELPTHRESFTLGSNYYDLPLYTEEAGVYDYEVKIRAVTAEDDENTHNNVISFTQEVAGKQSVLVIYDDVEDDAAIRNAYGNSADITSYYYRSSAIKPTLEWINAFDEIVLATANVTDLCTNSDGISKYNEFLGNLDTAVSMFGKSLVTLGDTNVQNSTRGELKALSDMLPVVYGRSEGQEKLFTLIIDTSRSMEQHGRLAHAKEAALAVVDLLEEDDTVAIVQFNGNPDEVVPRTIISDRKQEIKDAINALEVRQGTNIPAALQYSVPTATGGNYAERRLMLFSDGMNFTSDSASQSVYDTVRTLLGRGVVTSVLDVGRTGVAPSAKDEAESLLKSIAEYGNGEYMDISSETQLDKVLQTQLPADVNNNEGGMSRVIVRRSGDDALGGFETGSIGELENSLINKFIYSRAKGAATTVLAANFRNPRSNNAMEVPLYSYWDYGNGKVASFAAGLSIGQGNDDWLDMSQSVRGRLLQGILRSSVPAQKIREPFTVDIEEAGGYAEVTLLPAEKFIHDAVTSIEVTFENGRGTTTSAALPLLTDDTNGTLTRTFITGDEGKYTVKIRYKERATATEYTVERTVHVAYSSEYDSFALYDEGTLHKMIGANGNVYRGAFEIVNDEREVGLYNMSLSVPLLAACVVLFAVDIAVRKLKWEDIKSLFKRQNKVKKQ